MNIVNETVESGAAVGGEEPAVGIAYTPGSPGAPCRGAPVGAPAGGGELLRIKRPPPYDFSDFPSFSRLSWEVPCCFLPCLGVVLDFLTVFIRVVSFSRSSFQLNVALGGLSLKASL